MKRVLVASLLAAGMLLPGKVQGLEQNTTSHTASSASLEMRLDEFLFGISETIGDSIQLQSVKSYEGLIIETTFATNGNNPYTIVLNGPLVPPKEELFIYNIGTQIERNGTKIRFNIHYIPEGNKITVNGWATLHVPEESAKDSHRILYKNQGVEYGYPVDLPREIQDVGTSLHQIAFEVMGMPKELVRIGKNYKLEKTTLPSHFF